MSLRLRSSPPLTQMPLTMPPAATASANTRNPDVLDAIGEVVQQQLEARVGLVDAVAVHRLPPGHARERHGEMATAEVARLPGAGDRVLERGEDVVLVD